MQIINIRYNFVLARFDFRRIEIDPASLEQVVYSVLYCEKSGQRNYLKLEPYYPVKPLDIHDFPKSKLVPF